MRGRESEGKPKRGSHSTACEVTVATRDIIDLEPGVWMHDLLVEDLEVISCRVLSFVMCCVVY